MSEPTPLETNFIHWLRSCSDRELEIICDALATELFTRGVSGPGALFAAARELAHRQTLPRPGARPRVYSTLDRLARPDHLPR